MSKCGQSGGLQILKEFPKQVVRDLKGLKRKDGRIEVTLGKEEEQKCFSPLLYVLPQRENRGGK